MARRKYIHKDNCYVMLGGSFTSKGISGNMKTPQDYLWMKLNAMKNFKTHRECIDFIDKLRDKK